MSVRAIYDFATTITAKAQEAASAIPEGLSSFQKSISSTTFAFQKAIIPYVPAVTSQSLLLSAITVHCISAARGDDSFESKAKLYRCMIDCFMQYCELQLISIDMSKIPYNLLVGPMDCTPFTAECFQECAGIRLKPVETIDITDFELVVKGPIFPVYSSTNNSTI